MTSSVISSRRVPPPLKVGLYGTKDEIDDTEDFFPFVYIPVLIV